MQNTLVKAWSSGYILEHWLRVVAVITLIFTGAYIHWPFIPGGPESTIMASMRFVHFLAAQILVLGLIVRIYMAFCSTFAADWKDFALAQNIRNLPDILGYYFFVKGSHEQYRRYNPLQVLAYLITVLVIICCFLTGAALYHGNLFGVIKCPESFRWVSNLLGGESSTRIGHILLMWYFVVFMLVHVYFGILASLTSKDCTFSSIFTGYKCKNL